MPRGGRRQGGTGKSYGNRTDLNAHLPVSTPTGLPYGENQALSNAQRTVPMAPAPTPAGAPSPAPGANPAPMNLPVPGARPFLRPTERPNEPVTAGLPSGPGAGPEALGPLGQGSAVTTGALLSQLAQMSTAGPAIRTLAAYAKVKSPGLGGIGGAPGPQTPAGSPAA